MLRSIAAGLLLIFTALGASAAPAAEPAPLSAYGELPAVEHVALSPSGGKIAMIGTLEGHRMVLFLNKAADGSLREQPCDGGALCLGAAMELVHAARIDDLKVRGLYWAGEDAALLFYSDTQKIGGQFATSRMEIENALIVPASTGTESQAVFANHVRIAPGIFGFHGVRRVDGEWSGFFGGLPLEFGGPSDPSLRLEGGAPELYEVATDSGKVGLVDRAASRGFYRDWLMSRDGEMAVRLEVRDRNGHWEISNAKNKLLASGIDPDEPARLIALGPEGRTLIYEALVGEGSHTSYFRVPLDGSGDPERFLEGVGIQRNLIDPVSGRMIGYVPLAPDPVPILFDGDRQQLIESTKRAFSGRRMELVAWAEDFSTLLLRTSGNGDSGTWFLLDGQEGRAQAIAVERPGIRSEAVGPVSLVEYTASDGLEMDGILTLPPGREAGSLPLVMLPHGGPNSHNAPEFDWWAQAFASRGYAVFQPNFRGSTNRTQEFELAGDGEWGRKMQTDISDGFAHLAEQGIVDPGRACIVGISYGGYAALAGVTVQQGLYRCAVSIAGVSDLELLYSRERRESGRSNLTRRSLLESLGPRHDFEAYSPRNLAARADAPILLLHGRDDTVVFFEQSSRMADALKDAGKPHNLIELPGEDHWLSLGETRQIMLQETMDFVLEHNPPD